MIKYAIYMVLVLLALAVAAGAIFAMTFDPNRYKDDIERLVKERTGRTLKLSGELAVAFWPSLGAKVGGVTLSERGKDAQFLALDSAHASVALLPLLRGEVIIDGIRVSGLKAQIVKDRNGRFNFQDLLAEEKPEAAAEKPAPSEPQAVDFDIASVTVEKSAVSYRDLGSGQTFSLNDLNLSTGRIAGRAEGKLKFSVQAKGSKPALDAKVELAADYKFDLPARSFSLSELDATLSGAAAGMTNVLVEAKGGVAADPAKNEYRVSGLSVNFTGMQGKDALEAKLAAPSLVIAAGTAKGEPVNAEFRLKGEARSVEAVLTLSGVQLDLEKQTAEADIKAKIDESNLQGKLGLARFSPPAYRFDVSIDQLNLDRYFPPAEKAAAAGPSKESSGKTADTPVDLSALKGLDANGKVQVGALQARGLHLAKVKAEIKAANGRAEIAPHSAELYGGSLAGAISAQADGNRVAVKEKLTDIHIGPLLRDFAQQDRLEGRGNLSLDVAAAGPTVEAIKKALAGTARIDLKDGAIKGINIAQVLRKAKSRLGGGEQAEAASQTEKTDFSELSASFSIKNGVAHNEDLEVKSPLVRITGRGDIDIGASTINYTTKVAVVASAKGQGGAELEELRGLTVPVTLTGPFDNLSYKVNYGAVAADLAKSRAGEKVKEKVEERREEIKERLGERLKGLIKR